MRDSDFTDEDPGGVILKAGAELLIDADGVIVVSTGTTIRVRYALQFHDGVRPVCRRGLATASWAPMRRSSIAAHAPMA